VEAKSEIVMFLEMKSIQCDFSTNIVDEEWRLDFKSAIDIMEKVEQVECKALVRWYISTRDVCAR